MPLKITDFDDISTVENEDFFTVIDVSDSTMSVEGTNKKITAGDVANSLAAKITEVPDIVSDELNTKANIDSPTFTGNVSLPATTTIGSVVSGTELSYLDGVTSSIQTQLNTLSSAVNASSPTFSGTVTAGSFVGPLTGNSSTATTLQNSRAIACSGDIVGTTNFNGSTNVSIATTLSNGVVTPAKLSTGAPTWNSAGTLSATAFSGPLTGIASGNVKQGGGTDQGTNNIYIGWNSPSGPKLRVQVDNTDYASTWPIDISGNAATATALTQPYTLGTAQASTSGTTLDFTGIPSWVKRITVLFNGVSTNGTTAIVLRIGSGSLVTTGYVSTSSDAGGVATSTAGFLTTRSISSSRIYTGAMTINKITGNTWVAHGVVSSDSSVYSNSGSLVLGGVLDRVSITTLGSDTFDAGEVNISYE